LLAAQNIITPGCTLPEEIDAWFATVLLGLVPFRPSIKNIAPSATIEPNMMGIILFI
jgi:hypothetical protein